MITNKQYHVCMCDIGITYFDNNDSMPGISASSDKGIWGKYDYDTAALIKAHTGWNIVECT